MCNFVKKMFVSISNSCYKLLGYSINLKVGREYTYTQKKFTRVWGKIFKNNYKPSAPLYFISIFLIDHFHKITKKLTKKHFRPPHHQFFGNKITSKKCQQQLKIANGN